MKDYITYEHPLNEKIRIFLRIEYIWQQLESSLQLENDTNIITALTYLVELLDINERYDLKSEAIKQLDKLIVKFARMQSQPDIDQAKVQDIINKLEYSLKDLQQVVGKLSSGLYSNEWLSTIRQKMHVPGGFSPADLPYLAYWQTNPLHTRAQQISEWKELFYPLIQSIKNILFYIRKTNSEYDLSCHNGSFQKIIDTQHQPQLISVNLPARYNIYPEVSGNKYRISIRFLQTDLVNKAVLFNSTVDFKLAICW